MGIKVFSYRLRKDGKHEVRKTAGLVTLNKDDKYFAKVSAQQVNREVLIFLKITLPYIMAATIRVQE